MNWCSPRFCFKNRTCENWVRWVGENVRTLVIASKVSTFCGLPELGLSWTSSHPSRNYLLYSATIWQLIMFSPYTVISCLWMLAVEIFYTVRKRIIVGALHLDVHSNSTFMVVMGEVSILIDWKVAISTDTFFWYRYLLIDTLVFQFTWKIVSFPVKNVKFSCKNCEFSCEKCKIFL